MRLGKTFWMGALVFAALSGTATAETVITPYVGSVFGGDLSTDFEGIEDESHLNYGASLAFLGDGVFGFEVDGSYTPDFFGEIGDNNVTTLMGNIVLSWPAGDSLRIYAVGGGGLLKSRVDDTDDFFDVDQNDWGIDAGGGVMFNFSERLGVRGDIRYFRNLTTREDPGIDEIDLGDFDYWRATAGLAIRF
jgi:opacity protein-like surface antigen